MAPVQSGAEESAAGVAAANAADGNVAYGVHAAASGNKAAGLTPTGPGLTPTGPGLTPYVSPIIVYDDSAKVAVTYFRDGETGQTTSQIPPAQVVKQYRLSGGPPNLNASIPAAMAPVGMSVNTANGMPQQTSGGGAPSPNLVQSGAPTGGGQTRWEQATGKSAGAGSPSPGSGTFGGSGGSSASSTGSTSGTAGGSSGTVTGHGSNGGASAPVGGLISVTA